MALGVGRGGSRTSSDPCRPSAACMCQGVMMQTFVDRRKKNNRVMMPLGVQLKATNVFCRLR